MNLYYRYATQFPTGALCLRLRGLKRESERDVLIFGLLCGWRCRLIYQLSPVILYIGPWSQLNPRIWSIQIIQLTYRIIFILILVFFILACLVMVVTTNTHIETPSCFRRIRLYDLSIPPMTKSCSNRVSCVDIIDDPCHRHSFELALSSPSTIGNLFLLFLYFSNSLFNSVSRFVLFHKGMGKIHPHPRISSMTPGLDRGEGKLATDQVGENWKRIIIDHSQIIDCARTSQWYSVYQHFLDGTFLHDKPTISRGAIAGWQSQVTYCVVCSVYCVVVYVLLRLPGVKATHSVLQMR